MTGEDVVLALPRLTPTRAEVLASTLLSALWPDDHFVFDWRLRVAANVLRIAAGVDPAPSVAVNHDGGKLAPIVFDDDPRMSVAGWGC